VVQAVWWQGQWTWKYTIKKEPYDEDAQVYLTRDFLRLSVTAWEALEPAEQEDFLSKELWIKEKQKVRHTAMLGSCLHQHVCML